MLRRHFIFSAKAVVRLTAWQCIKWPLPAHLLSRYLYAAVEMASKRLCWIP